MIFSHKETPEDCVIHQLSLRDCTAQDLLKAISRINAAYTIQSLYGILRNLVSEEVVVKTGLYYSLNEEWRKRVVESLSKTQQYELEEGQIVIYTATSLSHMDMQWKNVVLPLHDMYKDDPIFFYNRHYIWLHLSETRRESELSYYKTFKDRQTYAFLLIGEKTSYDIHLKKMLQNEFVQCVVGGKYASKTDYITVFADYIITNRISKSTSEKIETCYREATSQKELESMLRSIGIEKKKSELIIERNKAKAKKLRKKFSKEFFVSRDLVTQFDLW